jgi:hypothetical protein
LKALAGIKHLKILEAVKYVFQKIPKNVMIARRHSTITCPTDVMFLQRSNNTGLAHDRTKRIVRSIHERKGDPAEFTQSDSGLCPFRCDRIPFCFIINNNDTYQIARAN